MKSYLLLITTIALVASLFATNNATTHEAVQAPKGNIVEEHELATLMPDADNDLICGIAIVKTTTDESCPGPNNGTSWPDTFTHLQDTLAEAQNCPNSSINSTTINSDTPGVSWVDLPAPDLANNLKIFNDILDMGAFEAQEFAGGSPCARPDITSSPISICAGETATFEVVIDGSEYKWYDSPTSTTHIASGNEFTTPALTSDATYYVRTVCNTTTAFLAPMPPQTSTFTGATRGYWFTAPSDFVMTSVRVPTDASTAAQSIQIVRFNSGPPPTWSATTTDFTTLAYFQNIQSTETIPVTIPISAGDFIGIIGNRGSVNSYSNAGNTTVINGETVALTRLGVQANIANETAPNLWQEPGNAAISRIEFSYEVPDMSDSTLAVVQVNPLPDPPTVFNRTICAGTTTTLNADGNDIKWYADAALTSLLATGNSYNTGVLTSTTDYFVTQSNVSGCESTASLVTVTVANNNHGNVFYVNHLAEGANNGTSWVNAFTDLQDALDINCPGVTEIWVAAGTYKPSKHPANCNGCNSQRDNTFQLKDGIALYGGFNGTETLLSERDIENNTTILSGDYNDDDTVTGSGSTLFISNNNENAYHVVLAAFPIDDTTSSTRLDGFTITGGNANVNEIISINGVTFSKKSGGGIYTLFGNNTIENNTIEVCKASFWGGGIYLNRGVNTLTNNTVSVNTATSEGGGVYILFGTNTFSTNNISNNSGKPGSGGGMYFYESNSNLVDNVISMNTTPIFGGGLYFEGGTYQLSNNTIEDNSASIGGGIRFLGGHVTLTNNQMNNNEANLAGCFFTGGGYGEDLPDNGTYIFNGNTISGNTSTSLGGAAWISRGNYTFTNNTISNNTAVEGGGGFLIRNSTTVFNENTISGNAIDNTTGIAGGGIVFLNGTNTLSNNTIADNSASNAGGILFQEGTHNFSGNIVRGNTAIEAGGGIITVQSTNTISNNSFYNNIADIGGGMYLEEGTNTLFNNSITGNTANTNGGGIYVDNSSPTITNTIIWNNTTNGSTTTATASVFNDNSTPTFSHSLIANSEGSGSWATAIGTDGGNNIDADPLFVDAANGDLRLQACSPAINAGSNASVPGGITTDLNENPRFYNNGIVDMGAYEYQDEPTPVVAVCQNQTVSLDNMGEATLYASLLDSGSSGCGNLDFTVDGQTSLQFSCEDIGSSTVILTVTDERGIIATCSAMLTVQDIIQPTFTCPSDQDVNLDATCQITIPNLIDGLMGTDNCGIVTFTQNPTAGTMVNSSHNATTIVTVTANDGNSNSADCTVTLTAKDVIQPGFTCPAEQNVNLDSNCQITIPDLINGLIGTDNCGTVTFTQNPAAGSMVSSSHNATTTVTVTANDGNGNTSDCTVTLTAKDFMVPTISCPGNISVNTDPGLCSAIVMYYAPIGTDNCSGAVITRTAGPESGAAFPVGMTMITHEVEDLAGNKATCSFTVTVTDNELPDVHCFDQTIIFNGENIIPLDEDDLLDATDNCGIQSISLTPNSISSNQVGQTLPVAVTVTDVNGNSATCTSQITIGGLPSGWSQNANGVGCTDGNDIDYNASNNTWTATSTNCYSTPPYTGDATAFAQYSLCGNGSITAQVTGISGTSLGWAGVVMRETNAPGAKKAQLTTNMSNFSRREFRTTTNGAAFPQQFPSLNRRWLKIVRSGNQFVMYISPNGISWAFAGAQNIQMNSCIEIGLVVSNYSSNSTVTATFANVSVTGSNSQSLINDGGPALVNVQDQQGLRDVKVYPNPTSGQLNIALSGYEGRPVTLEVYNTMGQMLYMKEVDEVQNADEIIDLSSVSSGMYLIRVSSDGLPAEMKRVTVAR